MRRYGIAAALLLAAAAASPAFALPAPADEGERMVISKRYDKPICLEKAMRENGIPDVDTRPFDVGTKELMGKEFNYYIFRVEARGGKWKTLSVTGYDDTNGNVRVMSIDCSPVELED